MVAVAEDSGLPSSGLNLVKLVQHQQRCTSHYIGLCWQSHSPTIIDLSRSCRYPLSIHFSSFAAATCPRRLSLSTRFHPQRPYLEPLSLTFPTSRANTRVYRTDSTPSIAHAGRSARVDAKPNLDQRHR